MSLIASPGGVGLLPAYAQNFLPSSVTSRPLKGDAPSVDLVLGYKKSNQSPILELLLSKLDELVARAVDKTRFGYSSH
jgi:LysR family hca operon transcriptional activator